MRRLRGIDRHVHGPVREHRVIGYRPKRPAFGGNCYAVTFSNPLIVYAERGVATSLEELLGRDRTPFLALFESQCFALGVSANCAFQQLDKRLWPIVFHSIVWSLD